MLSARYGGCAEGAGQRGCGDEASRPMSLRVVDSLEDPRVFRNLSMRQESVIYFHRAKPGRTTVALDDGRASKPPVTFLPGHDVDE